MLGAIAAAMLVGTATGPIQVDVGKADWSSMPPLRAVERPLPTPAMVGKVEEMLQSGQCTISGQSAKRFDIRVPYAVLVEPDGSARRVVVAESGCAPLESLVGLVVLTLAQQGDFRASGEASPRWYASELNFTQQ